MEALIRAMSYFEGILNISGNKATSVVAGYLKVLIDRMVLVAVQVTAHANVIQVYRIQFKHQL